MKTVVIAVLLIICALLAAVFVTVTLRFSSKDHSAYDVPRHPSAGTRQSESAEHAAAVKLIVSGRTEAPKLGREEMVQLMRQQLDVSGAAMPISSDLHPVNVDGIEAEWVIAPNAESDHRLLYIHGGGYVMGSPKSHRLITSRLSEVSGAAVLFGT